MARGTSCVPDYSIDCCPSRHVLIQAPGRRSSPRTSSIDRFKDPFVDVLAARKHISRWGVGNDVTDRYWQKRGGGQRIRGKSFPGFAPFVFGANSHQAALDHDLDLQISCFVNGQLMQRGLLSELICPPDQLVWQIIQSIRLLQGDLVFCGTFPGSALNRTPSTYLQAGDQLITEIQGLGRLVNPVEHALG